MEISFSLLFSVLWDHNRSPTSVLNKIQKIQGVAARFLTEKFCFKLGWRARILAKLCSMTARTVIHRRRIRIWRQNGHWTPSSTCSRNHAIGKTINHFGISNYRHICIRTATLGVQCRDFRTMRLLGTCKGICMQSGLGLPATVMELQFRKVVMQICIIAHQGARQA